MIPWRQMHQQVKFISCWNFLLYVCLLCIHFIVVLCMQYSHSLGEIRLMPLWENPRYIILACVHTHTRISTKNTEQLSDYYLMQMTFFFLFSLFPHPPFSSPTSTFPPLTTKMGGLNRQTLRPEAVAAMIALPHNTDSSSLVSKTGSPALHHITQWYTASTNCQ